MYTYVRGVGVLNGRGQLRGYSLESCARCVSPYSLCVRTSSNGVRLCWQFMGEVIRTRDKTIQSDEFRELEHDVELRRQGLWR